MIKIYTTFSDIALKQWDELARSSDVASFFQTADCYEFYATLTFLSPFVYGVSEDDKLVGLICGYIISDGNIVKRFFSRRAIVPGGVLLNASITAEALNYLLSYAVQTLSKKSIYLEIRNYNNYDAYSSVFKRNGFQYQPHLNFHLATSSIDIALKNLNTTKRRDVKLSKKEGVVWEETIYEADIEAYYKILSTLYKTKIKIPLFPFEFFKKIVEFPHAKLFIVKHKGCVIGGSVCVLLHNRTVYEWFVCGHETAPHNTFPSTVATWAGIEYAALNGYEKFDMMGAGKPDEGYGVREFKSKFGGELVEHGRFLRIFNSQLYSLGKYIIGRLKSKKAGTSKA